MSRKNLGRLVPTKKNVINKQTGTTSEITYYVDPDKDKKKDELSKVKKDETPDKKNKVTKTDARSLKNSKLGDDILSNVKDFEDFGKNGVDPAAARQFFCNM